MGSASAATEDLFGSLMDVRLQLEALGWRLLINGARPDVWQSGMLRSSGSTCAYRLHPGAGTSPDDMVELFDGADAANVVSVAEHRAAYEAWEDSVTAAKNRLTAPGPALTEALRARRSGHPAAGSIRSTRRTTRGGRCRRTRSSGPGRSTSRASPGRSAAIPTTGRRRWRSGFPSPRTRSTLRCSSQGPDTGPRRTWCAAWPEPRSTWCLRPKRGRPSTPMPEAATFRYYRPETRPERGTPATGDPLCPTPRVPPRRCRAQAEPGQPGVRTGSFG